MHVLITCKYEKDPIKNKIWLQSTSGLRDIHVWKCGRTDARTDARTPTRVPSYKLTLWAFGSGELKRSDQYQRRLRDDIACLDAQGQLTP